MFYGWMEPLPFGGENSTERKRHTKGVQFLLLKLEWDPGTEPVMFPAGLQAVQPRALHRRVLHGCRCDYRMNTLISTVEEETKLLVLSWYKNTYKNSFSLPVKHKPANKSYKAVRNHFTTNHLNACLWHTSPSSQAQEQGQGRVCCA